MKIRKFISIIVLTIIIALGLTFSSFATDTEDSIVNSPDSSVDDNLNNNEDNNQGTDTNIGNDSNGEDTNTGTDNDTNIGNDDTSNENPENDEPSDSYEEAPNQNENEYESPVVDTPVQSEKPTENKPTYNTVTETESDNADLRSLMLDIEGLSPEFDKDITDYYLIVDLTVESVNIEAYPEDENSIVMIEGNTDLQEGENIINITVRAEAGNTKTYTINVTKTDDVEMVNANLKNLSVKGFNFYPNFKSNIYNYNLTINEKISQLEIIAETEIEEATYEIIGNENLVEGDNLIKIIVTAKDGTAKREYKLNVYISSKNVQIQEMDKTPAIVLLSVLGIAIIGIAIAISKRH